ncbi:hypothetical protein ZWY2020_029566 [Hordeum vulgare]|nr:hypothetical protein ZWY2020_029566 [Hordeum vulgare]
MVATTDGSDCAALETVGVGAEEGVAPKKKGVSSCGQKEVLAKALMYDKDQKVGEYEEFSISQQLYLSMAREVELNSLIVTGKLIFCMQVEEQEIDIVAKELATCKLQLEAKESMNKQANMKLEAQRKTLQDLSEKYDQVLDTVVGFSPCFFWQQGKKEEEEFSTGPSPFSCSASRTTPSTAFDAIVKALTGDGS